MKFPDIASPKLAVPIAIVGIASLVFLYFWNPAEIQGFPKCPFFALTGYQCPGCGTLRGIHSLLHFRFADALRYNLLMVVSIPVLLLLWLWPRFRYSVVSSRTILCVVLLWWLLRNII